MPGSECPRRAIMPLLLVLAVVCAGCTKPERDLNGDAAALVKEGRWNDATVLLKQQILRHPDDVAAHFYLGRCYLNGPRFYSGAAAGEFETALRLFSANGGGIPIPEYGEEYFELRCHLELAKVHLRTYYDYAQRGAPKTVLQRVLRRLRKTASAAERITPDSGDVRELKAIVEAL